MESPDATLRAACRADINLRFDRGRGAHGLSRTTCVDAQGMQHRTGNNGVECLANREQNCVNGATFTYGSPDRVSGGATYGGYTEAIVVSSRFVVRIPKTADLAATAPLLCAGVTTFSPMQHWKLQAGQHVGVIGLGGLGHVAVKLAAARNADVTVFTTSPGKVEDAKRLGARQAVLSTDAAAMKRFGDRFQLLISTVPQAYPMQPFMDLLALDGTLVNVGALGALEGVNGKSLALGRKSLAGSLHVTSKQGASG